MKALGAGIGVLLAFACGDGVDRDLGLDGDLRVGGASFFRGSSPEPSGGPAVLGAFLGQATFRVGEQDKTFGGVVEAGATGVAVALDGTLGYWLVPTGVPLAETPDLPSFDAPLSFSLDCGAGATCAVGLGLQRGGRIR